MYLLICLCESDVLLGMWIVVMWFLGLFVGLLNILKLMLVSKLVMFVNFNGLCRFGLLLLKCVMVFLYVMCGKLLRLMFSILLNKLWIMCLVIDIMLLVFKNVVLILIWVNFGWWLVCKFLLWKYLIIW